MKENSENTSPDSTSANEQQLELNEKPEELFSELTELIGDDIPLEKREKLTQLLLISQHHSGPLPPPLHLEKYNQIIPNGAERLMQAVEKEGEHRREMQRKVISNDIIQSYIGQVMGFVIAIAFLGVSAYLITKGHNNVVSAVLGSMGLVGLVSVFVIGRKFNQKIQE